ncbi:hypothetical protein X771_15195 [Mesorhizobium sp. LSJC277A00]|nr:hypothetical protein X771_15195 [Mesorhizobium sp. LSJC277A00]
MVKATFNTPAKQEVLEGEYQQQIEMFQIIVEGIARAAM